MVSKKEKLVQELAHIFKEKSRRKVKQPMENGEVFRCEIYNDFYRRIDQMGVDFLEELIKKIRQFASLGLGEQHE